MWVKGARREGDGVPEGVVRDIYKQTWLRLREKWKFPLKRRPCLKGFFEGGGRGTEKVARGRWWFRRLPDGVRTKGEFYTGATNLLGRAGFPDAQGGGLMILIFIIYIYIYIYTCIYIYIYIYHNQESVIYIYIYIHMSLSLSLSLTTKIIYIYIYIYHYFNFQHKGIQALGSLRERRVRARALSFSICQLVASFLLLL